MKKLILFLTAAVLAAGVMLSFADDEDDQIEALENRLKSAAHERDVLAKLVDDVLWTQRVGDVAVVEKVRIYGPPKWREENPNGIGAGNPVKFYAYLFTPKNFDSAGKLPLLVLPHGGVHADFTTYYAHIVRELMAQGYIVVAPEYRGSTGYGKGFYETHRLRRPRGRRRPRRPRLGGRRTTPGSTRTASASSAGATAG